MSGAPAATAPVAGGPRPPGITTLGLSRHAALAGLLLAALAWPAAPARAEPRPIPGFIQVIPGEGRAPVDLAAAQVVRIGRVEGFTVIDTTAWVQQRSIEPVEVVARRLAEAGVGLVPLTDLNGSRIHVAVDRIVLVRASEDRHAAGARAALVLVGLRFNRDVAVRESPEEVKAALRRLIAADAPAADPPPPR